MLGSVPKLLPLWNGVAVNNVQNTSKKGTVNSDRVCLDNILLPDHGGAGVDMVWNSSSVEWEELKLASKSLNYGSEMCALPFLPPNKVSFHHDPCLRSILRRRKKDNKFCLSLQASRYKMAESFYFRKKIFSTLDDIPDLVRDKTFDEIFVPESTVKLAKLFPKKFPAPNASWDYQGGCMAVFSDASSAVPSHHLLHPVGPKLSQLAVTPLKETSSSSKAIQAQIKNQQRIRMKSGKIFQVVEDSNIGVCGVRNKKKYHYMNLNNMINGKFCTMSMESFCFEEQLSDLKLSPYVPGEHLVASYSGMLFLENAELRKRLWQLKEPLFHDPLVQDMYWWCDFGAHPRCVLYSDRQRFGSLDLRSKSPRAVNIFSSPNPFLHEGEQIAVARRFASVHFQHLLATDRHLFICDERYPQQPVMSWSHMLKSVPLYCDIKQLNTMGSSKFVILLASQESSDIASFQVGALPRIQPLSLSLPFHVSKPQDCAKILRRLDCAINEDKVIERLSLPLTGVSCVPHSNNDSYTVLQVTSFGDVFYQRFQPLDSNERADEVRHWDTIASDNVINDLSSWTESLNVKKKTITKKRCTFFKVERRKILNGVCKCVPSSECLICKPTGDVEQFCEANVCPRCGLYVEFQKSLCACAEKSKLLCGTFHCNDGSQSPPHIPVFDISKYSDACSQMILNTWDYAEELNFMEAEPSQSQFEDNSLTPSLLPAMNSKIQAIDNEIGHFISSQQSCIDDDMIPPTQEITSQSYLYSKKKTQSKVKFNAAVAF